MKIIKLKLTDRQKEHRITIGKKGEYGVTKLELDISELNSIYGVVSVIPMYTICTNGMTYELDCTYENDIIEIVVDKNATNIYGTHVLTINIITNDGRAISYPIFCNVEQTWISEIAEDAILDAIPTVKNKDWELIFDEILTEDIGISDYITLQGSYKELMAICLPNSNRETSTAASFIQVHSSSLDKYFSMYISNPSNYGGRSYADLVRKYCERTLYGSSIGYSGSVGGEFIPDVRYEAYDKFRIYTNSGGVIKAGVKILLYGKR